jgi:hypothetical protein
MQNGPQPWIITIYAVLLVLVGCSTSEVNPPTPAALVSLSVSPSNSSIAPGTTVQMTATGTFADNSMRNVTASVTWDSSDPGIATISNTPGSQGLATATTGIGSTVISAVAEGITGTTALTTSHVQSIAVMPSNPPCVAPGTTQQFTAEGTLVNSMTQNLTSFATWNSSDTGVAIVSDTPGSKGLATAFAPGTASIQATYDLNTDSATLISASVASIVTTPTSTSIPKGTKQQFTAIGTLSSGCTNTQDVTSLATWTTSNTTVATVSDTPGSKGLATAVDVGSATIAATIDSAPSFSATLTVTQAVLESIEVTPANQSIALGQTKLFIATGTYSDGTTLNLSSSVHWNSSDIGVATISDTAGSNGLATSKAQGTTAITANFSGITSNTATLTVTQAQLMSITIIPASASTPLGTIISFIAKGTFTDGSTQDLTTSVNWVSSNTFIATISNIQGFQGLATSSNVNVGTTTITAISGSISGTALLTVTFF